MTSRRGTSFFDDSATVATKQRLRYLQSRKDVQLRIESFDATSVEAMRALETSISTTAPVGGCFVLALVLKDGLFSRQTQETFHAVSDLKLDLLKACELAFDLRSLEFFVTLSSLLAVVGNPGQSNYTA